MVSEVKCRLSLIVIRNFKINYKINVGTDGNQKGGFDKPGPKLLVERLDENYGFLDL